MLPRGDKLYFIVLKQLVATLETLKTLMEGKNAFALDNWD